MGAISSNSFIPLPTGAVERLDPAVRNGLERVFAPMVSEYYTEPIRLTQDADKGADILYAVGRGPSGVIVQFRNGDDISLLMPLISFWTHQPAIFDTLDDTALNSLLPPEKRPSDDGEF